MPPRAKWWAVELRFDRPLRARELRLLETVLPPYNGGCLGVDGGVWPQWWNSWPGSWDTQRIVSVVQRLCIGAVVRAAPFGRDCAGGTACGAAWFDEHDHRCRLGDPSSGAPVFTDDDWIGIDPNAPRSYSAGRSGPAE